MEVIRRILLFLFLITLPAIPLWATKYVLKDGRVLEGKHALLSRIDEKTDAPDNIARPIVVIDDGLRHVFMSKSRLTKISDEQVVPPEKFKTGNAMNYDGKIYRVLGAYQNVPFDKYGRRLLEIRHVGGVELCEQAITELTPYYLKISGQRGDDRPIVWDMRLATNTIPREQITPILYNLIDTKNVEDRLKLVRFYYGGKIYNAAEQELQTILDDWKDNADVQERITPMLLNIRQQKYQIIIDELEHRWNAGQFQFVRKYLAVLEKDDKLPDRLLEPVRRMLQRYDDFDKKHNTIIAALKALYEKLPESEKSQKILPIIDEIDKELNGYTLKRLATYELYANDPQLSAAEKLAFAITGWYAGADADNSRLAVAVQLQESSQMVENYLNSDDNQLARKDILAKLRKQESARPDLIAGILATMPPPKSEKDNKQNQENNADTNGGDMLQRFSIRNPLLDQNAIGGLRVAEIRYCVQLPPEYNPNLRYPLIISLNGLAQTPEMQLDWWKTQAGRNGYIVLAPDWNPPEHRSDNYDFSAFSHAAVIGSMKDVFKRFNIDTDRVFISGHGIGGTAAWDLSLAHPDLWAGAVAFNAVASKYIDVYRAALRFVPLYLVCGEMEGVGMARKWDENAAVLNRYLQKQVQPGDVTVVRYIGRGQESFSDEILHIFEWMKLRQRVFVPTEFEAETMRTWDCFFWWVEMPTLGIDKPENMIDPVDFPNKSIDVLRKTISVTGRLQKSNNAIYVSVKPKIANVQIFLTPDMIDFKAKTEVKVNDKRFQPLNGTVEPDIKVMLEDVRTRGDRLHPFWAVLPIN